MRTAPNLFTGVHDHVFACFEGSKQVYPSHLLCQSSDALFCKHIEGSYGNHINRNEHIIKAPKSDDGITEAEDVDFVQIYEHAKYSHSVSNKGHQVIKVIVVIGETLLSSSS